MSEPKRWLEEGAPRDIELLMRAARAERPDETSLARTLTALGVGLGVTSIAAGAGAAGTAAGVGGTASVTASITGALLAKWGILGATLGTLVAGAATLPRTLERVSESPAPSALPPERRELDSLRPAPELPSHVVAAPSTPASVVASAAPPPVERAVAAHTPDSATPLGSETLAEEVKSMDRARATLAAGRAVETLAVLDDYERRFSEGRFAPEVLYLRMEANALLGRTAESRAAAERLLASYPKSPHGARARVLLSKTP
jgi:hypothetical protein